LFHLSYLITLKAYQCSKRTPNIQIMYFMFDWWIYRLFVLNITLKRNSVQIMIFVNVCSTWSVVYINDAFYTSITRNDVNGISLLHLSHLINLMAYLCSQWTPNVQINYFIFDWSIYRLFVLNWAWKRVSHQIMIFVFICSTWGIVELNTRFETWITRNDVNAVSSFHLSYLISLMA
jgi:hypothetical protein